MTPDAQTVSLDGNSGTATVVLLPNGTGYLGTEGLASLESDSTYQLWAVQSGKVISAGLMSPSSGVVAFHVDADTLEGLVLTIEEAGGVPVSSQPASASWFPEV